MRVSVMVERVLSPGFGYLPALSRMVEVIPHALYSLIDIPVPGAVHTIRSQGVDPLDPLSQVKSPASHHFPHPVRR